MSPQQQRSLESAAQWYATLLSEDVSERERQEWQHWLTQSPENQQAWQAMEAIGQQFQPLQQHDGSVRSAASNSLKTVHGSLRKVQSRRQLLRGFAGLLGAGSVGWLTWRYTPAQQWAIAALADQASAVGQVRQLRLQDGTQLWLHSASAVDVHYGAQSRLLRLRQGEILIETAQDAAHRPFFVHTSHGQMQALGTRFSVRLQEAHTQLSVLEGAVQIQPEHADHKQVVVRAGEQTAFSQTHTDKVQALRNPHATAWTDGIVVADGMPLAQLAAELARFSYASWEVDPAVAHLRVLGTYPLTDTPLALDLLAQSLPVRVERSWPWRIRILAKQ